MQNYTKAGKSDLPAMIVGIREAVARAEQKEQDLSLQENIPINRTTALALKQQIAQRLIDFGMKTNDVAVMIDMSASWVYKHTKMSDEHRMDSWRTQSARARVSNQKRHKERREFYEPIMLELRELGHSNAEIAEITGFAPETVKRYIGCQPDELSLMAQRVGNAKRFLRERAVKMQTLREQPGQGDLRLAGD